MDVDVRVGVKENELFLACVNISKTAGDTSKLLLIACALSIGTKVDDHG